MATFKLTASEWDLEKFLEAFEGTSSVEFHKISTLQCFELIQVIGEGSYGKVILGKEKATSHLYAIKVIRKERVKTKTDFDHTKAECRVLKSTNHPFLTSLKYAFQTTDKLYFVLEFINGGDLFFHLSREDQFSEERTRFYIAEIICAISYLHGRGIIYRDLKLENILLDKDGHIKITDFGLCKDGMTDGRTTRTICGTPNYLAPEVLGQKEYGRSVDWWGVGVVMYEILSGKLPFNGETNTDLFSSIQTGTLKFPRHFSEEAKDLVSGLLIKDPKKRLGSGEDDAKPIMAHPFFGSINWEDLELKKISPPFKPQVTSADDTRYFDDEVSSQSAEPTTPPDCSGNAMHFPNFSFNSVANVEDLQSTGSGDN